MARGYSDVRLTVRESMIKDHLWHEHQVLYAVRHGILESIDGWFTVPFFRAMAHEAVRRTGQVGDWSTFEFFFEIGDALQ